MTAAAGNATTGIILCGGAGRRFGGADKPLLIFDGRPLVGHVIERLQNQVQTTLISANRNLARYRSFAIPVVEDRLTDQGPLAGILAAGSVADSDWFFVCPGDAPFLPLDLIERLCAVVDETVDAVVPHDGERVQYLFLLARRSLVPSIEAYLASGARSVHGWLNTIRVRQLACAAAHGFTNINTAAELLALQAPD